jgi:hypothetical protein
MEEMLAPDGTSRQDWGARTLYLEKNLILIADAVRDLSHKVDPAVAEKLRAVAHFRGGDASLVALEEERRQTLEHAQQELGRKITDFDRRLQYKIEHDTAKREVVQTMTATVSERLEALEATVAERAEALEAHMKRIYPVTLSDVQAAVDQAAASLDERLRDAERKMQDEIQQTKRVYEECMRGVSEDKAATFHAIENVKSGYQLEMSIIRADVGGIENKRQKDSERFNASLQTLENETAVTRRLATEGFSKEIANIRRDLEQKIELRSRIDTLR